ncbi:N-acetylmuramidase domain-containing protein [Novosphingobium aerophilum]|uniref:N-acetylmuramidase domain-containing protein n=1 Tax=Novosphingobium aerophilum TaxID=2839843 RepID=UPI003FD16129
MADEFKGNSAPLSAADYEAAAKKIGCSVAAIRAVSQVESAGGGFLADGRPKILFERHIFHKLTKGNYTAAHSDISWPKRGGYVGGAGEYPRLRQAIALDRKAALQSASWGRFQIMGFNYASSGYADVEAFVKAMVDGEAGQLDAFVGFIRKNRLDDELIRLDWAGFARGYNGPDYAANDYHNKMRRAYESFMAGGARTANPTPVLKLGDKGQPVLHLQQLLGLPMDGDFGPATKTKVIAFQKGKGLYADGIVGAQTWLALQAPSSAPSAAASPSVDAALSRQPLRFGDKGEDVAFLQKLLKLPADGAFGSMTAQAVMDFQKSKALKADGVVGAATWAALLP